MAEDRVGLWTIRISFTQQYFLYIPAPVGLLGWTTASAADVPHCELDVAVPCFVGTKSCPTPGVDFDAVVSSDPIIAPFGSWYGQGHPVRCIQSLRS